MFSEFQPIKPEQWYSQLEKELKGKSLDTLGKEIDSERIKVHYFDLPSDWDTSVLSQNRPDNNWQLGESFDALSHNANSVILDALLNGCNTLDLWVRRPMTASDFEVLLRDIQLDIIDIQFRLGEAVDTTTFVTSFCAYAKNKSYEVSRLQGKILGGKIPSNWQMLPNFKFLRFEINNSNNPSQDIAELLHNINKSLEASKLSPSAFFRIVSIQAKVGTDYFLSIAILRAIKLLLFQLQNAYDLVPTATPLIVVTGIGDPSDPYTNTLRATTMAMSAVVGGADTLFITPPGEEAFARRVARNIHHLMSMEAYLNRVIDPASGAYYVEHLTHKIVEKSWAIFTRP